MKIDTNGTRIHVKQQGEGTLTLVFLHYYGGSARTWDAVAGELADRYRIVALDHRGWGASDAPDEGYGIADLAADAEGVIEQLQLQRYVLVGHSMGGKVAQLIASRRPLGLEGLVLVAPSPPSPTILPDEQRAILLGAYQSRESVEFVIDHVLTASPLDAARRQQVIEDSLAGAPQAKAGWPEVAMRDDITRQVALIYVPTIVLSGELDQVDRVATLQKELLPRIPHAALHVLPGIGHLSPLEAPEALARKIAGFIRALDEGSATCASPQQFPANFDAAFNSGDIDALLALFTTPATMRMTGGELADDPAALRAGFAQLLEMRPRLDNVVRRVIASGDIALLLLDWTLRVTLQDGKQHETHGSATQVLEQGSDGGWRLRISNPLGLE